MWPPDPVAIVDRSLRIKDTTALALVRSHVEVQPKDHCSYFLWPAWAAEFGLTPVPLDEVHVDNRERGRSGLQLGVIEGAFCLDEFLEPVGCDHDRREMVTPWLYEHATIRCAVADDAVKRTIFSWLQPCGLVLCCLWCMGTDPRGCSLFARHLPVAERIPARWEPHLRAALRGTRRSLEGWDPQLCFGQQSASAPCGKTPGNS